MDIDCLKSLEKDVLEKSDQPVFIKHYLIDEIEPKDQQFKQNKKVAIKVYERIKLVDSIKREIVKRELEILQKINHPNII